ncbi:MAG: phosphoribosylaminoimidazolesuccinocarboxamide synthase [Candidatus Omnitrophica bacterium]|nr:phosphoribosylaminoimidazolesuccinocarboxamide synthase [Candidatus Omnitrophota bacterium]
MSLPPIPQVKFFKRGKVREIYEYKDMYLMIASDRISSFDVVLPTAIPHKGEILTQVSSFWFGFTKGIIDNHLITADINEFPGELSQWKDALRGRTMLVKKADPVPVECVVRGYLSGSGWTEYKENQTVCGNKLPAGLRESDKLPEPIFTPATKEETGHDINVSQDYVEKEIGKSLASRLKEISIAIYKKASEYAESKGIIIADTKFEFGLLDEGKTLILIDEALTPDSSRFWPKDEYEPGRSQSSFDKQFVRDYLLTLDWDKTYPGPELPEEVVNKTYIKYSQAYEMLTGKKFRNSSESF